MRSAATRESAVNFMVTRTTLHLIYQKVVHPVSTGPQLRRVHPLIDFGNLLWRVPMLGIYSAKTRAERQRILA